MNELTQIQNIKMIAPNIITLDLLGFLLKHFGSEDIDVEEGSLLDNYYFPIDKNKKYTINDDFKDFLYYNTSDFEFEDILEKFENPNCDCVKLIEAFETIGSSKYNVIFE